MRSKELHKYKEEETNYHFWKIIRNQDFEVINSHEMLILYEELIHILAEKQIEYISHYEDLTKLSRGKILLVC